MTVMAQRGKPEILRSDNGSQFTATAVMAWLQQEVVGPSFILPGHPGQNGFIDSFHSRWVDKCLNCKWFRSKAKAAVMIEHWRRQYNTCRPHGALGYKTPAQVAASAA